MPTVINKRHQEGKLDNEINQFWQRLILEVYYVELAFDFFVSFRAIEYYQSIFDVTVLCSYVACIWNPDGGSQCYAAFKAIEF